MRTVIHGALASGVDRDRAAIAPARTSEDLPLPDGPTTATNPSRPRRSTTALTNATRPKKRCSSSGWYARRPMYGQLRATTVAPLTAFPPDGTRVNTRSGRDNPLNV